MGKASHRLANYKNVYLSQFGGLTSELQEEYPFLSETLLSQLSFTHFIELIKFGAPLERLFYEVETI